jgi:hypothetical protein
LVTRIIFDEEHRSLSSSLCSVLHTLINSSLLGQIFSSAPYSQTSSAYVPPLMWTTRFHLHICRPYVLYYKWYMFFCTHKIISQNIYYSEE